MMDASLLTHFEAQLGQPLDGPTGDVERALRSLVASAESAWSTFSIPAEVFVAHVGARVADEGDPIAAMEQILPQDLYLACACAHGVPQALAAFDTHVLSAVPGAVRRIGHSDEFVDEVTQRTRFKLLVSTDGKPPRIHSYKGTGRLRSWVQVAAVRTALEVRRRERPQDDRDPADLTEVGPWQEDPELAQVRMLYREEFSKAFKEALAQLESRERNVLRMYLLDGLNIDEIGRVYGVHRATVARWMASTREKLLSEARARLMNHLKMGRAEFESLMAVVRSHLDLSLERFLT